MDAKTHIYEVEQYELHIAIHQVRATSEAQALDALKSGQSTVAHTEFVSIVESRSDEVFVPATISELQLMDIHVDASGRVPAIRKIIVKKPAQELAVYEAGTKTIRKVPENYCLISLNHEDPKFDVDAATVPFREKVIAAYKRWEHAEGTNTELANFVSEALTDL